MQSLLLQSARDRLAIETAGDLRNLLLWKFEPGPQAVLSPAFTRTRRQEADRLITLGTTESAGYAWTLDPTNPLVHIALAAHVEPVLADFYRAYGLRRLPEDGMIGLHAAELLLAQGLRDEAQRTVREPPGSQRPELRNSTKR